VVREAAVLPPPDAAAQSGRGDGAGPDPERRGTLAAQRVLDDDVVRRGAGRHADAQVAAAVDDEAPRAGEALGGPVRGEPLRRAAGVQAQSRRPPDRPGGVVEAHGAPAPAIERR
jgi:hypothetical protein